MQGESNQIIILGSSLGARLAAVLLARQGQNVTHFCPTGTTGEAWETAPLLLIRFLELLDARTCLRPAKSRAILTRDCRLELHGSFSLKDELLRELERGAEALIRLLASLEVHAEKLTEYFWDCEGVPVSLAQRLLLSPRFLRHGLSYKRLNRAAKEVTRHQLNARSTALLETCITGHTQVPFPKLTYAELALAWSEISSSQEVAVSALNDLLVNRFQSAGGHFQQLSAGSSLEILPGKQPGIKLAGQHYHANQVFIGTGLPMNVTHLPSLSGGYGRKFSARFLAGAPSEFLSELSVSALHGGVPILARLHNKQSGFEVDISLPYSTQPVDQNELTTWLAALFPFSDLQLGELSPGCQLPKLAGFPGRYQPFKLADAHYWNISGASVFPTLLNTGECLAAMTLAAQLAT
jgi:hypothetical protein